MNTQSNTNIPVRLALPPPALKRLSEAGIRCNSDISLEYQKAAGRYVLRGRESGGAVKSLGRYVSFCAEDGQRLPWFIRPDSLTANSDHAIAIAPILVSLDMFRYEHTYELLIARHTIAETDKGKRPRIVSQTIFRGWQGQLPLDLSGKDKALAGTLAPEFFDRSGEPRQLPAAFAEAVQAVTVGANCIDCAHPHLLVAKPAAAAIADACAVIPEIDGGDEPLMTAVA